MHLWRRVRNRRPWNRRSGDPRIQAALLLQASLYCSGQKTSLATRGTAMMIRKQNFNTQTGKRKEQRSSDSTEENGNRNEETQHGPSQSTSHIGNGQKNGKKLRKRFRWSCEEMKDVVWCCTYIKEMTLWGKYKEVYKLWRERKAVLRINLDAKALLNQKNYNLKSSDINGCWNWWDKRKYWISNRRIHRRLHKRGEWRQNGCKLYRITEERQRKWKHWLWESTDK